MHGNFDRHWNRRGGTRRLGIAKEEEKVPEKSYPDSHGNREVLYRKHSLSVVLRVGFSQQGRRGFDRSSERSKEKEGFPETVGSLAVLVQVHLLDDVGERSGSLDVREVVFGVREKVPAYRGLVRGVHIGG